MLSLFNFIAQAEPAGGLSILQSQQFFPIIIMVGFLIFFYFVVIMPQNKKKKEMEKMLKNLKKGDKVTSIGGVHGKVVTVKDAEIVVKIDDNATITFDRNAISRVGNKQTDVKSKKDEKAAESKDEEKK